MKLPPLTVSRKGARTLIVPASETPACGVLRATHYQVPGSAPLAEAMPYGTADPLRVALELAARANWHERLTATMRALVNADTDAEQCAAQLEARRLLQEIEP